MVVCIYYTEYLYPSPIYIFEQQTLIRVTLLKRIHSVTGRASNRSDVLNRILAQLNTDEKRIYFMGLYICIPINSMIMILLL